MDRDSLLKSYAPEFNVLTTNGRLVGEWSNVFEHCLMEARVASVLAKRLGFSEQDSQDLIKAAILHDWNKRNEREEAEAKGFEAYNKQASSGARALLDLGYSERIVTLVESVGHTSLRTILSTPDPVARVMHYIDTITFNDKIVGVDQRIDALESAPRYKQLNESGRAVHGGRTYLEVQREVGKKIEAELEERIREKVIPLLRRELGIAS
jgi:putative nucleotidyltransferase with HDIG domain